MAGYTTHGVSICWVITISYKLSLPDKPGALIAAGTSSTFEASQASGGSPGGNVNEVALVAAGTGILAGRFNHLGDP